MAHMWKAVVIVGLIAGPAGAQAPGDPVTAALKRQWDGVALNIRESAEKMPAEKYAFKPSPDVKSFGSEVGHGANTHYFFCARIKGEPNPNKEDFEKATDKDALVKALIASNDYCGSVLSTANDKWLMETIGQGAQAQPRVAVLGAHIAHSNETYGTMVPYLRMSGVVPPSTARAQQR